MTNNEKKLVKAIVNHDARVMKLQDAVKENFGLDTEYDSAENTLTIKTTGIVESMNAVTAKEYIYQNMPETEIFVKF